MRTNIFESDELKLFDDTSRIQCKRGKVYKLGRHRLMCGDSMSEEDVKALMGGAESKYAVH